MKLSELITSDLVEVPLRAADKWEALAAIARIPARAGRYPQSMVPVVEQALVVRERSMTTGMEHGIAIPHCRSNLSSEIICSYGHCLDGLDFDSLDGEPVHSVFLLITPP